MGKPPRKRPARNPVAAPADRELSQQDTLLARIADSLALIAVKGRSQEEQIATLDALGYAPAQIGRFIGTTPNAVSVALYKQRQGQKGQKRKSGRPPSKKTAKKGR